MAEKAADIADRFIQTKEEKASFEMELKKVLIDAESRNAKKCNREVERRYEK